MRREKKNSQTNSTGRWLVFFFESVAEKGSRKKVEEPLQQLPGFFLKSGTTVLKKRVIKKSRKTVPKSCPTWPWSTTTWSSALAGTLGMFIVVGPCSPMEAVGTGKGGYEVHLRNAKYWKCWVRRERFDTFKKKGSYAAIKKVIMRKSGFQRKVGLFRGDCCDGSWLKEPKYQVWAQFGVASCCRA